MPTQRAPAEVTQFNSITIRLFSEHQSIPADKAHSGFTKTWRHRSVKKVGYLYPSRTPMIHIGYAPSVLVRVKGEDICLHFDLGFWI